MTRLLSRTVLVALILVFATPLLAGCAAIEDEPVAPSPSIPPQSSEASAAAIQMRISELLSSYSLKPDGSLKKEWSRLSAKDDLPLALYAEASAQIGLDPTPWADREVWVYSTKVDEKMLEGGSARAYFLVGDGAVVGAYLAIDELIPGVVALNNSEYFAPPKLSPKNLDFSGAQSVEVIGPWMGSDWKESATLTGEEADEFLSLLAQSTRRRGDRFGVVGDEEYMFIIKFNNGSVVRARLTTKRDGTPTFVTFSSMPYENWYYTPPVGLKPRVKSLL